MIANAPYLVEETYNLSPIIFDEINYDSERKKNDIIDVFPFYNICHVFDKIVSAEEIITNEHNINRQLNDQKRILSYIKSTPSIFALSTEQYVLSSYEKMRNGLMVLSLDIMLTDISQEDECLYIYGEKNNIKFFFNLFFEHNNVETLVNVSTKRNRYVIEDNIENSIQQLFKIFQEEVNDEYVSSKVNSR